MRKAIIIGSSIEINNNFDFNNLGTRSAFSTEERARQTMFTLNSIKAHFPDDEIFLVDSSTIKLKEHLKYPTIEGVTLVKIEDIDKKVAQIIRTHHNKSYCEALLLKTFFDAYKEELNQFDFIIKTTGRYWFHTPVDTSMFNKNNIDKVFTKYEYIFDHPEKKEWGPIEFRIDGHPNYRVGNTPTVLYAWGKKAFHHIYNLWDFTLKSTQNTSYDIENIFYYWIHQNQIPQYKLNWVMLGYGGNNAKFYSY